MATHVPNWESLNVDPSTFTHSLSGTLPVSPVKSFRDNDKATVAAAGKNNNGGSGENSIAGVGSPLRRSPAEIQEEYLRSLKFTGPIQGVQPRERRSKIVDYDNGIFTLLRQLLDF
jgi:hypothetical protein